MAVRPEPRPLLDTILVDNPQWAVLLIARVVVGGEAEGVVGVEPAMVGMASQIPGSFRDADGRRWAVNGAVGGRHGAGCVECCLGGEREDLLAQCGSQRCVESQDDREESY